MTITAEPRVYDRTSVGLYDPGVARERVVTAGWARNNFRELLNAAASGIAMVVLRRSTADAVMISRAQYEEAAAKCGWPTTVPDLPRRPERDDDGALPDDDA